jgi:beta-glucosidase
MHFYVFLRKIFMRKNGCAALYYHQGLIAWEMRRNMIKKIIAVHLVYAAFLFAQPPASVIDTVLVPLSYLKLVDNASNTYKYVGKVAYTFTGWSNDRFTATMSLVKDGGGDVVPLTSVKGDVGASDRWGTKGIYFTCQFTGRPSGTYKAKIVINATKSDTAQKVEALLAKMDNAQKASQCTGVGTVNVTGVPSLGIAEWHMDDGPYGKRGGYAFLTGEAMASTFDTAICQEGGIYKGQDFRAFDKNIILGPTLNLVRDGRGGRTYEAYGEDPYLAGKMTAADSRGLQSVGCIPTIKHYACNNIERARNSYPVYVSERTLREIYTYGFRIGVQEGGAMAVMSAYNGINGMICPGNKHLNNDLLKGDFGFKGILVSDWGANTNDAASATGGLDVSMPSGMSGVAGLVPQYLLDDKVRRSLHAKYVAGCFDAGYATTKYKDSVNCKTHYDYMRRATRKAMILAKNDNNLLPLDKTKPIKIALVGTWSNSLRWFVSASSLVNPMHLTTPKDAITKIGGSNVTVTTDYASADYALVCVGPDDKGEGVDRVNVSLPDSEDQYCSRVLAVKPTKTIVFYTGGSCADSGAWSRAPAIIMGFFPGEDHTLAMAEVLFGDYNPAGRIPFTFPLDSAQLPRFGVGKPWDNTGLTKDQYEDAWEGRGYPYFDYHNFKPLFCFGHGLSYTTFEYANLQITPAGGFPGDTFFVKVAVKNTGARAGEEVVQLYVHDVESSLPRRYKDLRGFSRVALAAGETKTLTFTLTDRDLACFDDTQSAWIVEPGRFEVLAGASSLDIRQKGTLSIY